MWTGVGHAGTWNSRVRAAQRVVAPFLACQGSRGVPLRRQAGAGGGALALSERFGHPHGQGSAWLWQGGARAGADLLPRAEADEVGGDGGVFHGFHDGQLGQAGAPGGGCGGCRGRCCFEVLGGRVPRGRALQWWQKHMMDRQGRRAGK